MRAVVFVNGEVQDYVALARWLRPGDRLIGADGGTHHILALNLQPHAVVGDLDSLEPETVAELAALGVSIEQHPVAKDQTDLELAIERGLRDGADEILLLGALGGRLDQTLANLLILAQRSWPVPLRLAEGCQLAQVLRSGGMLVLPAEVGSTVSAIPLSTSVTGITYTGLAYPLHDATLTLGSTRGVSNVVAAAPATITIREGVLLVVCVQDPQVTLPV
jgi:thiamine pyrophosphokinase